MLLFAAALTFAAAPPPIVNGDITDDYPEVVLLYMTDSRGQYGASCTGSVISQRWVVTASHCITDSSGFEIDRVYVIRADSLNDAGRNDYFEAKDWYAHPDYNGRDGYNDIAMVEMEDELDGPYMSITDRGPEQSDVGEDFRLVGYGSTGDDDNSTNPQKRTADVPLYDYDAGLLMTWDRSDNQNACYGDSGGPLMRLYDDGEYALAGVMDFVSSCENGGLGSARVDAFVGFIEEYTDDFTVYGEGEANDDENDDGGDDDDITKTGDDEDDDNGGESGTLGGDDDGDLEAGDEDIIFSATCAAVPGAAGTLMPVLAAMSVLRRRRL